ncbi:uncharacterized protein LOC117559516 isoform X1 [Gymnodraco acuticeps]|uniref:Uncharacterized protein LOC117559516 isoform X1 n=1 Tax=Gymnodraco acuticeps TaxID=8218 RepID=A0A6P8VNH0_GYMAC|nr:uncharacterized protein LOC117559516 isoform X1 [Gymnodraco acuticeps]
MLRHIYTTMKITLRDSSPVVLTHNQCSCVAGTVLCNHTVALLFQTAHYTELNMPVVPPVHSCTESEQQWHKPRTMGVKPGPINSMVFTKPVPNRMVQTGEWILQRHGGAITRGLFRVTEAYSAFSIEDRPLVTTMNMRPDKPLVESAFGIVQEGSVLSYQMPALTSRYTTLHTDTPPTPHLPIEGYVILPCDLPLVCSEEEQLHMNSLSVDLEMSHKIEEATREQSSSSEWHLLRKPRVTASRFREICHVRGESSANSLAEPILKGTRQTAEMRRGAEMEPTVAAEYSRLANVNYSPCGLVIHPSTPWLGASPDGVVFDRTEYPQFGLVEFKCPKLCRLQICADGMWLPKLKKSHAYYWKVQGQLLVSGMQWCDFVVWRTTWCKEYTQIQKCKEQSEKK